jgi:hypothetical protein
MTTWVNPLSTPVNYVRVNGARTPMTYSTIRGAEDKRKYDELVGPGLSGGYSRFLGKRLSHFELLMYLYTPEDWSAWYRFKPVLAALPKSFMGKSFAIWHPWCVDCGITAACVETIKQPKELEPGVYVIEVEMIEFRIPKRQVAKLVGTTSVVSDPYEMQISQLSDQLAKQQELLAGKP